MTTVKCGRGRLRIKPRYEIRVKRNGHEVYRFKRTRDLLVWRGQSILAYLLSQGAVGTPTSAWKIVISSNDTNPDMGDDSGDPLNNEFNPTLGDPVDAQYDFIPTTKPSGAYQTFATLTIYGTVTVTTADTLRKIGIIDSGTPPDQHIIIEDAVVPFDVNANDNVEVYYYIQLG